MLENRARAGRYGIRNSMIGAMLCAGLALANSAPAQTPPAAAPEDPVIGRISEQEVRVSDLVEPNAAQLRQLATKLPPDVFEAQTRILLTRSLQEMLLNRLMVDDATRALTPDQQVDAEDFLREARRKLIDEWGDGDAAVAERRLREKTGSGLAETIAEQGERMIVRWRFNELFEDRMHVTADEIRREYDRRLNRYITPSSRTIRIIATRERAEADRIEAALAAGTPFAEVASRPENTFRREQGGMPGNPITGDDGVVEPLNAAMLVLEAGARSPRLEFHGGFAWVYVESFTPEQIVPLEQARDEIEKALKAERYKKLSEQHVKRLMDEATYTSLDEMVRAAVTVASRRYLRADRSEG